MHTLKFPPISFNISKKELLWIKIVSTGLNNYETSFKQLIVFAEEFTEKKNNGTFFFKEGFFVREFKPPQKKVSFLQAISQIPFLNLPEMQLRWVPNFSGELKNKNQEEFKIKTFVLDECKLEFGIQLSGEESGQNFLELVYLQPVLIRLTFEKKSRQLVDLLVKPKTPLLFQKLFSVQPLYFAVRQNLASSSQAAGIQNRKEIKKKATLSVYWNPFQSEASNTFERTVSFDGGAFRRQIEDDKVTILLNWAIDPQASEALFSKEGPEAFKDVFLAKNCKIIFRIGDKKLEILEFQNPQTITRRSDKVLISKKNLACFQTWIFKPLN